MHKTELLIIKVAGIYIYHLASMGCTLYCCNNKNKILFISSEIWCWIISWYQSSQLLKHFNHETKLHVLPNAGHSRTLFICKNKWICNLRTIIYFKVNIPYSLPENPVFHYQKILRFSYTPSLLNHTNALFLHRTG